MPRSVRPLVVTQDMIKPVTSLEALPRYLEKVRRVFDVGSHRARPFSLKDIQQYYSQSSAGYEIFHSEQGSVHMALNFDGRYNPDGFKEQARIVRKALHEEDRRILEVGCGKGFNLKILASEETERSFQGIDITPSHLFSAKRHLRDLPNTRLVQASFESLPFVDLSQDVLFEVESVCHAADMRGALSEAFRVLRSRGRFLLFDAFRINGPHKNPDPVELAVELIEGAMAVPRFWVLEDWLALAKEVGFSLVTTSNISDAICPNLNRLQFLARGFFKYPSVARGLRKLGNPTLVANAIAGLLLPFSIEAGAHGYFLVVLEK